MDVICKNCGSINDYRTEMKSNQQVAYCNGCDKFIKNIPYQEQRFYVGKYFKKLVSEVTDLNSRRPKAHGTIEKELQRARKRAGYGTSVVDGVEKTIKDDARELARNGVVRDRAALALFAKGATYEEIAEAMEFDSVNAVRLMVDRALGATISETRDHKRLRAIVNLQIDEVTRSIMPRATDPKDPEHLAYARMALAIFERKSKLNGLDAPQIHLINPDGDELDKFVQQWAIATGNQPAPEIDIFALEQNPETGVFEKVDD